MVLLQQQAQAQAVGKKARELYVGNLTVGAVTDATLMELFNGSLGSILAAQGDSLVRCRTFPTVTVQDAPCCSRRWHQPRCGVSDRSQWLIADRPPLQPPVASVAMNSDGKSAFWIHTSTLRWGMGPT